MIFNVFDVLAFTDGHILVVTHRLDRGDNRGGACALFKDEIDFIVDGKLTVDEA